MNLFPFDVRHSVSVSSEREFFGIELVGRGYAQAEFC